MNEYDEILNQSEQIYDMDDIQLALDAMAAQLNKDYADKNPLILCVMNGSIMTCGHLLPRLKFKMQLDYVHASRYREKTTGGKIQWFAKPSNSLEGRHIILVEDIFDEGFTLAALREFCVENGAESVVCACLFNKQSVEKHTSLAEYIGLNVPNRYVFGFGMDKENLWRNLPGVYALKGS